jgi:hypothetical protein
LLRGQKRAGERERERERERKSTVHCSVDGCSGDSDVTGCRHSQRVGLIGSDLWVGLQCVASSVTVAEFMVSGLCDVLGWAYSVSKQFTV